MKPIHYLALFLIPMGFIIAAVPQDTTHPYKLSAVQLLEEATGQDQFVSPDIVADMIIKKDPSLQLIDVRTPEEFEKFSLPGAINIPLASLLGPDYKDVIDQDVTMNVFYSNSSLQSSQAWLITRQLGYKNNYILQGGLNYWAETIMNPEKPSSLNPDEELAKYDFRKGASMVLGGGELQTNQAAGKVSAPKPVIKKAAKKKIQGGC